MLSTGTKSNIAPSLATATHEVVGALCVIIFAVSIYFVPSSAFAALYLDDFEGSSGGTFPSGWVSNNQNGFDVVNGEESVSPTHSYKTASTFSEDSEGISFAANTFGNLTAKFWCHYDVAAINTGCLGIRITNGTGGGYDGVGFGLYVYPNASSTVMGISHSSFTQYPNPDILWPNSVVMDDWNDIRIDWRYSGLYIQFRVFLNTDYDSGWITTDETDISALMIQSFGANGGATPYGYIDDVRVYTDADSLPPVPEESSQTRIISMTPSNMEYVSTTTYTFHGSEFYVNESEWEDDMFLRFKWKRNQDDQVAASIVAAQGGLWQTFDFPTSGGDIDWNVEIGENEFATTTLFSRDGQYTFTVELRKHTLTNSILGFFGLDSLYDNGLVVSSTTQFIAGQRTAYDVFIASTTEAITGPNGFFASSTISLEQAKNYCNFSFSFSITDCFSFLFGWQSQPMSQAINNLKDGFFSYVPLGYITRSITILSSSATSTLPDLTYTFPNSAPGFLSSTTIEFSPWQYFYVDGAPVKDQLVANDGSGKNIWDIFEPLINIIVYLSLILLVIKDLTGIHANHRNNL